jgi:hypothetical protein
MVFGGVLGVVDTRISELLSRFRGWLREAACCECPQPLGKPTTREQTEVRHLPMPTISAPSDAVSLHDAGGSPARASGHPCAWAIPHEPPPDKATDLISSISAPMSSNDCSGRADRLRLRAQAAATANKAYLSLAGPPGVASLYGMSVPPEARGQHVASGLTAAMMAPGAGARLRPVPSFTRPTWRSASTAGSASLSADPRPSSPPRRCGPTRTDRTAQATLPGQPASRTSNKSMVRMLRRARGAGVSARVPKTPAWVHRQQRRADCSYPCEGALVGGTRDALRIGSGPPICCGSRSREVWPSDAVWSARTGRYRWPWMPEVVAEVLRWK